MKASLWPEYVSLHKDQGVQIHESEAMSGKAWAWQRGAAGLLWAAPCLPGLLAPELSFPSVVAIPLCPLHFYSERKGTQSPLLCCPRGNEQDCEVSNVKSSQ